MSQLVAKDTVVTLVHKVTDPDGNIIDQGLEPLYYLHGGYDDIFPKIEEALQGKKVGESVVVKLAPDECFGEYDAELVQMEPRADFPEDLKVGAQFDGAPEGSEDGKNTILYTVTDIADDKVVLDGNHPLAGMALVFACTVIAVRAASSQEIAQGHL